VQKAAWDALAEKAKLGHPGAAVALEPKTGAVIALASFPSYDPNLFATGIKTKDYRKLQTDPLLPQINRAIYGGTAPGSTFKMITASAGLEHNLITPTSTVYCSGGISLGGRWRKRCHKLSGHGSVNLNEAISKSCDVYFYLLARRLGPDRLAGMARKFGLGSRTGLDIVRPNDIELESAGIVPDPAFKKARYNDEWRDGDMVDYGIGQSMLGCTPIQMANVAAALANRGVIYRPQLVKEIIGYDEAGRAKVLKKFKPEVLHNLNLKPSTIDLVVKGAISVMQPGGTAYASAIPGLSMAGKTGTAQRAARGKIRNKLRFGFARRYRRMELVRVRTASSQTSESW
jgi:penicillin-binding protein 2